jgi:peptidyl-tRNA hydrolase, PTH1 family
MTEAAKEIKAIIGLGNPGAKYYYTRHNIGFRVLDELANKFNVYWREFDNMQIAQININSKNVLLIKPQTFMNTSGQVIPYLKKKNIEASNILVIHDELELPFGDVKLKLSGSAKGHNGLKSIISFCGPDFYRLRIGISRPEKREEVPDYVLENFNKKEQQELDHIIFKAVQEIENLF